MALLCRFLKYTVIGDSQLLHFTESPTIETAPQPIVVGEKDSDSRISFTCVVTGALSLRVSWFTGEKNLTNLNPSHYEFDQIKNGTRVTSVLTIKNPTYEDSGEYSCVATILDGNAEFTAYSNTTLTVIGQ